MGNPSSEPTVTPEDQLYELQSLLGEYHGLLTTILHRRREFSQDWEIKDLLAAIENAFPGVSVAFGEVQGELNTGKHDAGLEEVALTAEQFKPKLRGFRFQLWAFLRWDS
jgi:hypothetical protein